MTLLCLLPPLLAPGIDAFLVRWNMSVKMGNSGYCSWLEVTKAGDAAEIRLVGRVGGARQLDREFTLENGRLRFVTQEWFGAYEPVTYDVAVQGDSIEGSVTRADGTVMPLQGVRAPRSIVVRFHRTPCAPGRVALDERALPRLSNEERQGTSPGWWHKAEERTLVVRVPDTRKAWRLDATLR